MTKAITRLLTHMPSMALGRLAPALVAAAALAMGPAAAGSQAAMLFSRLPHEVLQMRFGAFGAALPDGDALIAGGEGYTSAEVFNPATENFEALTHTMAQERGYAATASLPGGKVLIVGGVGSGSTVLASAELFNPATDEFEAAGHAMTEARQYPSAAMLPDGKVLIAGGYNGSTVLASAELFNPATDEFEALPHTMSTAREAAGATTLPNGKVLIAGGNGSSQSAELFDPSTLEFEALAHKMTLSRPYQPIAISLPEGRALIADGTPGDLGVELFNPATLEFEYLGGEQLVQTRNGPVAAMLRGDRLLVAGGAYSMTAEIAKPMVQAQMVGGSFGHQPVGEPSATQFVNVTSTGSLPLLVSNVTLTGAGANAFEIEKDTCAQTVLTFRQACALTVIFTPPSAGSFSATLTLEDNESTPNSISLSGTGVVSGLGSAGPAGAAGPAGSAGKEGTTGLKGPSGAAGRPGPRGPAGKRGPAGDLELVRCLLSPGPARVGRAWQAPTACTLVSNAAPGQPRAGAAMKATLARGRTTYASGTRIATRRGGHLELLLTERRPLGPGHYTLILSHRQHGRWTSLRAQVMGGCALFRKGLRPAGGGPRR